MTRNKNNQNRKSADALKRELKAYHRQGIDLWLEGSPSTPGTITKACRLAEKGTYMRDYVEDEDGDIYQIHFDLIRE